MDTREAPTLDESIDEIARMRVRPSEKDVAEAQMLPLRRALAIPENDVHAPIALNDDIPDCEEDPACFLSFQDLNRLRESTFRIIRPWVPGWLWTLGERVPFVRTALTHEVSGDLVGKGARERGL